MTDELDQALARLQERRGKTEKLRTSMAYGMDQNPDSAAKARALADRMGTSQEYALGDLEHLGRAARASTFNFDDFIRDYPRMAGWLENPANAAIAHDDLDSLAGIEAVASRAKLRERERVWNENIKKRMTGAKGFTLDKLSRGGSGILDLIKLPGDIQSTLQGALASAVGEKSIQPGADLGVGPGGVNLGLASKVASTFIDFLQQKLKGSQREAENLLIQDPVTGRDVWNLDAVNPLTSAGLENAAQLFAGEAPSMAAMIGLEAATGGAATPVVAAKYGPKAAKLMKYLHLATRPSALATVARTVQGQREEGIQHLMRKGMSRGEAEVKSAPGALLAGVFSFAAGAPMEASYLRGLLGKIEAAPGGQTLVRRIGGKVMGLTAGAAKEGAQEVANGIGEDLASWMTTHPDLTFKQAASNAIQNFYGGAVLGGASSGLAEGFKSDQKAMTDLADVASRSKLLARDPKAFLEAATAALKDTAHEHVFVDAGQFQTLFQSKGLDPAAVAQLAGALNYEEAVAAGTDLVLPMAEYLTHLAKDHHKDLAPDLRMKAGDPSQREMDALQAAGDQDIKAKGQAKPEEADEQARIDEAVASLDLIPRFQIQDETKAQLIDAGYDPSTAETYARAHAAVMFNLAEQNGLDPLEMHRRYGLTVSRPMLEERPDMPVMDIVLGRLEAQQRAAQEAEFEMFGQPGRAEPGRVAPAPEGQPGKKAMGAEPGGMGTAPEGLIVLAQGSKPLIFGSKEWNEYYKLGKGSKEKGDLAKRARAGLKKILTTTGQREDLARREAELRAEYGERLKEKADFDAWDREVKAIIAGDVYSEDDQRGFIQFGADRKFQIGLLRDANLSTFIHEAGHFYIEIMHDLAAMEGASEQLKADLATLRQHAGADTEGGKLTEEQHEILARSHEAYLLEGKSPSEELRPVFARMASWMTFIYKVIERLGVRLNKDVRGVFDRMYASEMEIAAVKSQAAGPMFATAADMGVSQAEFDLYVKTQGDEIMKGTEALHQKLMAEMNRERTKLWEEELEKTIEEVRPEVETDPAYVTLKTLVGGVLPDGTKIKLNRESIVDFFGKGAAEEMPKRTTVKRGGVDVQTAAEMLGFNSGEELVGALRNLEPMEDKIRRVAEDRMKAAHGDMMLDGSISDAAVDALHNDAREDVLAMELRALKRKASQLRPGMVFERQQARAAAADRRALAEAVEGEERFAAAEEEFTRRAYLQSIPPHAAFRNAASQLIQKMRVRDINPNRYLQAQRKHGALAFKLNSKGEWKAAADAKQKELMNHHLYLEAVSAKAKVDSIAEYGRKLGTSKVQARIAKAKMGFLAQINGILERYSFVKVPLKKLDEEFQSLASFALQMASDGQEVAIDPALFDEQQRNYQEMTLTELEAVRDALKNLEVMARRMVETLTGDRRLDYETVMDEMKVSAFENRVRNRPIPVDPLTVGVGGKVLDFAEKADSIFVKMELLVDWLDGGDIHGAWRRELLSPISVSQTNEYDMTAEYTEKVRKQMESMPKDQRMKLLDTYDIPGIGIITKHRILSMAMHMGNESNHKKMMKGMGWANSPDVVAHALSKLNRQDWEFVQGIWDTLENLGVRSFAFDERMTGLAPEKIEARPFTVEFPDGSTMTLRGGYYPMVYNPSESRAGRMQESGSLEQLFDSGYAKATTPKGHLKARVENFAELLLLDFEQELTSHLAGVIKDISHREAIIHINHIITDSGIRRTIQETLGPAYEAQFLPWLRHITNDRSAAATQGLGDFRNFMMSLRGNMVVAALGFKAGSVLVQGADFIRASDRVKPRHMAQAALDLMRNPKTLLKEIREMSGEMRHRPQNLDRDLRGVLKRGMGQEGALKGAQRFAFEGIGMADTVTSTIVWLGAYRQSLADGKGKETAIMEANRTVSLVLQAGNPKDMTALQRGDNLAKFITTFMGDAIPAYAILRDAFKESKEKKKNIPRQAARVFWGVMLPAIVANLIKARGPGDDEEPAAWAIKTALLSAPNTIPVLRDVVAAIESKRDYRFTPAAAVMEKSVRLFGKTADVVSGEDDDWVDFAESSFDAFGTGFGIPGTAQILTTSRYLRKVSSGEISEPESGVQFAAEAALGRNPKKK